MADYALSNQADRDLTEIYIFTYQKFSPVKADSYLLALDETFLNLAENPHLGKQIDSIRKGYFRYEHVSHSIFYKRKGKDILIVRVLHQKMDAKRHI